MERTAQYWKKAMENRGYWVTLRQMRNEGVPIGLARLHLYCHLDANQIIIRSARIL